MSGCTRQALGTCGCARCLVGAGPDTRDGATVTRIEAQFALDGRTFPPGSYLVREVGAEYAYAITAEEYRTRQRSPMSNVTRSRGAP